MNTDALHNIIETLIAFQVVRVYTSTPNVKDRLEENIVVNVPRAVVHVHDSKNAQRVLPPEVKTTRLFDHSNKLRKVIKRVAKAKKGGRAFILSGKASDMSEDFTAICAILKKHDLVFFMNTEIDDEVSDLFDQTINEFPNSRFLCCCEGEEGFGLMIYEGMID